MKIKTKSVIIKTKTIKRPGSGRPRGAYSFVRIPWSVLKLYVGQMSEVTVSRRWAEANGIYFAFCGDAQHTHNFSRLID